MCMKEMRITIKVYKVYKETKQILKPQNTITEKKNFSRRFRSRSEQV